MMRVTRGISFICFAAILSFHSTFAGWERDDYLSAFSTLSGLVLSVNSMIDGLKDTAVTLSVSNSADFNLINPNWYTQDGTTMDTPPPSTLMQDGTMIVTFKGPLARITTDAMKGSMAFLTYEIEGTNKWMVFAWNYAVLTKDFIVRVVDKDPSPSTTTNEAVVQKLKEHLLKANKAGDYGTWNRYPFLAKNVKYEAVYSMGAGSVTPFQVFLAKKQF